MSKPTDEEMRVALDAAAYMVEHNKDPKFLAKALLNLNYRVHYFEEVFKAAEKYINFGQEEFDHQNLIKAMDHARQEERRITNQDEPPPFGL